MNEINHFVCGFIFADEFSHVLLSEKKEPAWQAGLWTGLSGQLMPSEAPKDGMIRIATAMIGITPKFIEYAVLHGNYWDLHVFFALMKRQPLGSMTEEPVCWQPLPLPRNPPVYFANIGWLIEMAISIILKRDLRSYFEIHEK